MGAKHVPTPSSVRWKLFAMFTAKTHENRARWHLLALANEHCDPRQRPEMGGAKAAFELSDMAAINRQQPHAAHP